MSAAELANVAAGLVLPPGGLIILALIGLILIRLRPGLGLSLAFIATLTLYAIGTPFVATRLVHSLESPYVDPTQDATGQAIVVLGGGLHPRALEYGADTVSRRSLERVRYAAYLQKRTGKPILLTGGNPAGAQSTEAAQMAIALRELGAEARWLENASDNTRENARYTRRRLEEAGISRIYLVTHGWHMPRAQAAFEKSGLEVIPASIAHVAPLGAKPGYLVPSGDALELSAVYFRELGSTAWYHLQSHAMSDAQPGDGKR